MFKPLRRLVRDRRGMAIVEFAYSLPILLTLSLTGAELVNYITVRMRISQLALQAADNASRLGAGSVLVARRLSETDINDLLIGAGTQAGGLDLYGRGRLILSDLEPDPDNAGRFRIRWQRCRGARTRNGSSYGLAGARNMAGMGPAGRQVTAMPNNATMFVEIFYDYQPLVLSSLAPSMTITDIASMTVRERRDLSRVYNTEDAPVSRC